MEEARETQVTVSGNSNSLLPASGMCKIAVQMKHSLKIDILLHTIKNYDFG
jgi:hypothetical protein